MRNLGAVMLAASLVAIAFFLAPLVQFGSSVEDRQCNALPSTLLVDPHTDSSDIDLNDVHLLQFHLLNNSLAFLRAYLKDSTLQLVSIESIKHKRFEDIQSRPVTVTLRNSYGEPFQAYKYEETVTVFLDISIVHLLLSSTITTANSPFHFSVTLHIGLTPEKRWTVMSLMSDRPLVRDSYGMPQSQPIDQSSEISAKKIGNLRIVTMNLWNYNHWLDRLPLLDAFLHKYKPDIIGIQELRVRCQYFVGLYPYEDHHLIHSYQIYDLLNELSYFSGDTNHSYQYYSWPAMFFQEETPEQQPAHIVGEGLALFSKYPIIDTHTVYLERDIHDGEDFHQRLLLGITVQIDDSHKFDFFTTHLSLSAAARNRTLPSIGEFARSRVDNNDLSLSGSVIMGDFNHEFDYDTTDILSDFGMIDAWKALGRCNADTVDSATNDDVVTSKNEMKVTPSTQTSINRNRQLLEVMFENPNPFFSESTSQSLSDLLANMDEKWRKIVLDTLASDIISEDTREDKCSDGWTFNCWNMCKRIDYLFVNHELLDSGRIIDMQIVGDEFSVRKPNISPVGGVVDMNDTLYPSDHRFIIMDISLQ